jgi:SLAP domain-containing protein
MQELLFAEAWDRTISDNDRSRIKKAFQEAVLTDTAPLQFSPLWRAVNYRGELLITVIIHNKNEAPFAFSDQTVNYKTGVKTAAKHIFTLPFLINGKTSMPWTFIFPKESIFFMHKSENGKLELEKSYDPH